MSVHDAPTREVLRHAGMSEQSELTTAERRRIPAAAKALAANERISSHRIYRILRPKPSDEPHKDPEK